MRLLCKIQLSLAKANLLWLGLFTLFDGGMLVDTVQWLYMYFHKSSENIKEDSKSQISVKSNRFVDKSKMFIDSV